MFVDDRPTQSQIPAEDLEDADFMDLDDLEEIRTNGHPTDLRSELMGESEMPGDDMDSDELGITSTIVGKFGKSFDWRALLSSLRTKLIVPYVVLSLATAMVGMFVVTRLVTSTIRERFSNQLLEASRVTADSIVRREQLHLEQLRLMVFTQGVADALLNEDSEALEDILYPLVLNSGVHSLTAVSLEGNEVLSLVMDPETGEYEISSGADLSDLDFVTKALAGQSDPLGDKYAGIAQTRYGPYLLTASPVRVSGAQMTGVLIMGTRLETLITDLKKQVLADLIILDQTGTVMAATLPAPDEGYQVLGLNRFQVADLDPAITRELDLFERSYQAYYAPLVVRKVPVGVVAVVLPSNFIVTTESVSRNTFSLIFTLGTMSIIVVGYVLARSIARPVMRLRDISMAVASGNLDQQTGLTGKDEIGQLAAVFDLMTFRLRRRTEQAQRLYAETVQRNKELAEANTRLQIAQQQLLQSEKLAAIGQLTAGIVHDVKNPLAVISGLTEEIQMELEDNSPIAGDLKLIRENAFRANSIVTDLLKFARQSDPEMRRQDITQTVEKSLRLTDYLARKGNVELIKDLGNGPAMTVYDAQQLEQVIINLIQNAIQAMQDGGRLWVSVKENDPWVEVLIQDTGVGIPQENLNRIFDPFFTTKPEGEGTGLGLSVSYGIVSQHKGQIDVESKVGKGTRFTIRLPRKA